MPREAEKGAIGLAGRPGSVMLSTMERRRAGGSGAARTMVGVAFLSAAVLGASCDSGGKSDAGVCENPTTPADNGCTILVCPVVPVGGDTAGDTYASFAQPFFTTYCTRCHSTTRTNPSFSCADTDPDCRHGAPLGHDWDDPASIRTYLDHIRYMVGNGNAMPPSGLQPSCDERFRLVRWIDAGAPGLP